MALHLVVGPAQIAPPPGRWGRPCQVDGGGRGAAEAALQAPSPTHGRHGRRGGVWSRRQQQLVTGGRVGSSDHAARPRCFRQVGLLRSE